MSRFHRHWPAILLQTLDVALDGLSGICECFLQRVSLGEASWEGRDLHGVATYFLIRNEDHCVDPRSHAHGLYVPRRLPRSFCLKLQ